MSDFVQIEKDSNQKLWSVIDHVSIILISIFFNIFLPLSESDRW